MALVLLPRCFLPTGSSQPNCPYWGQEIFSRSGLCLGIGLIIISLLSMRDKTIDSDAWDRKEYKHQSQLKWVSSLSLKSASSQWCTFYENVFDLMGDLLMKAPPVIFRLRFIYLPCRSFQRIADSCLIGVTRRITLLDVFRLPLSCSMLQTISADTFSTPPKFQNQPQQLGAEKIVRSDLPLKNSYPSSTTWCDLQIRSNLCFFRNSSITLLPQRKLTPRSKLLSHPTPLWLGSDQSRSQMSLQSVEAIGLFILLISSKSFSSGLSPPCTQKMRSPMMAATGRNWKVSETVLKSCTLNFCLHSSQKPQTLLSSLHSWFPRSTKKLRGYLILSAISRQQVSRDFFPRSTQSPRNRQLRSEGSPIRQKIESRSANWPWVSPQTTIGGLSSSSMGCPISTDLKAQQSPSISSCVIANLLRPPLRLSSFSFSIIQSILMALEVLSVISSIYYIVFPCKFACYLGDRLLPQSIERQLMGKGGFALTRTCSIG